MLYLLFVCRGNTCRSPMAEGLARHLLGDQVHVESAGLAPGSQAHEQAVAVLQQRYGVDISAHRPRQVESLPVEMFDRVIALDPCIFEDLCAIFPRLQDRITAWNIDDPYDRDFDVYARTATEIETEIRKLGQDLGLKGAEV